MKKLAIIGASYLQEPLIQKAKKRGLETHVFAWAADDVGEKSADFFYPISIVEKERILEKCREIGIDGICSISSDLAAITVNYVAAQLGLLGNSILCTDMSTNKHSMRLCFEKNGDPSPKSVEVSSPADITPGSFSFPVIVKPTDRSGSRGVTKVLKYDDLPGAIEFAKQQGFEKKVLVEEYVCGQEYSIECISWRGNHTFLSMTKKYTTGHPNFIETAHLEPAPVSSNTLEQVKAIVFHALDSLEIEYGASHSEVKIDGNGEIKIIEIGGRMGGDNIGSSLVELSTGYDFVNAVIDIALGSEPVSRITKNAYAAIRFILSSDDLAVYYRLKNEHPEIIVEEDIHPITDTRVSDSSTRFGYFTMVSNNSSVLERYLPCSEDQ